MRDGSHADVRAKSLILDLGRQLLATLPLRVLRRPAELGWCRRRVQRVVPARRLWLSGEVGAVRVRLLVEEVLSQVFAVPLRIQLRILLLGLSRLVVDMQQAA